MQYMEIQGKQYPIIGQVERENGDTVPLLDIKMMSDEEWQRMAKEKKRGGHTSAFPIN